MKNLAKKICTRLDEHLAEQQHARNAISTLAAGAAFEGWLAFETRLLVERNREELGLGGFAKSGPRFWTANEYRNIDFYVGDVIHDAPVLALEFKLIHNNKNWSKKADEVWGDLFPARARKAELVPQQARFGASRSTTIGCKKISSISSSCTSSAAPNERSLVGTLPGRRKPWPSALGVLPSPRD